MEIRSKFWIENKGEVVVGGGKTSLLLAIDRLGSIKHAANEFGMSYRHAWGAIRKIERRVGFKILDTRLGRKDGGARLTPKGKEFVMAVDSFLKEVQAIVKEKFNQRFQACRKKLKNKGDFGLIKISQEIISPYLLLENLKTDLSGSIVMHIGVVRPNSKGRKVVSIEYEIDKDVGKKELLNIAKEIRSRWEIQDIVLYRRKGRLNLGDIILIAVVAAPHHKDAFDACKYAVESMKIMKSIKKKETLI